MRLKELRGLPVIDPTAARKVGTVQDYQVDPVSGRLAALDISGVDGRESAENAPGERIPAERIRRVGTNAVMLVARGGATPGAPPLMNTGAGSLGIPEQAAIRPPDITMATALRQPRRLFVCFRMSPLLARPPTRKKAQSIPIYDRMLDHPSGMVKTAR